MPDDHIVEDEAVRHAEQLLDRPLPKGYLEEWTELLRTSKRKEHEEQLEAVSIMRIGTEWLAIPTRALDEVVDSRPIHALPHRTGKHLLGVVNIRGRLRMCVSLHSMMQIEEGIDLESPQVRFVVLEDEGQRWAFPVNEMAAMHQYAPDALTNVPVTAAKSSPNLIKGVIDWKQTRVSVVEPELLFASLRRALL